MGREKARSLKTKVFGASKLRGYNNTGAFMVMPLSEFAVVFSPG